VLEHAGRQIDAFCAARDAREFFEDEPGAATDLEHLAPAHERLDHVELELIEERMVAWWRSRSYPVAKSS
jgi:hypothetical protein